MSSLDDNEGPPPDEPTGYAREEVEERSNLIRPMATGTAIVVWAIALPVVTVLAIAVVWAMWLPGKPIGEFFRFLGGRGFFNFIVPLVVLGAILIGLVNMLNWACYRGKG